MEHSVFHNFHNLVTKSNATKEELMLLCNDYPTTPLTWCALCRVLPPEESRPLLLTKARELGSLDLWRELIHLEEPDPIARYEIAKEAVHAVGHDPRSGLVWATFLGLYAALHNAFLSLVTKDNEEQALANGAAPAATQTLASAVAPLIQLVPAEKSYSERHASTVGNLSISTFFTSPTGQGTKAAAVENAMLTSPIAFLAPEVGTLVSKSPPSPEALRALVARGELNFVTFCEYLRKLCIIPVQDVPVKSVRQVLATLMPEMTVDPAAAAIQKSMPIDFEAYYPLALFHRPASAIVPALEAVSVPGWTRLLRLETSNWLRIKDTDAALYEERLTYFFAVALRQCANVPDIRFLQAQRYFAEREFETGLKSLVEVPLAARQMELAFVVSDVYELFLNDLATAITTLCRALSEGLQGPARDDYASHRTHAYLMGSLVYHIALKRLRQGGEGLESMIYSILNDASLKPAVTEDLLISLLLLAANSGKIDCKALLERMLQLLPHAAILISLQHTERIPPPPDYFGAYVSCKTRFAASTNTATLASTVGEERAQSPLPTLLSLALTHSYMLAAKRQDVVELMRQFQPGQLCTPQGAVDYQEYIRFATALPSDSLCTVSSTLLPTNPLAVPPMTITSSSVKGVIELGRKLDTLIDIARQLRDGSLKNSTPNDFKAAAVLQVFQKAVGTSKHLLTERQLNELQALTQDPACLQSLRVWLNDA